MKSLKLLAVAFAIVSLLTVSCKKEAIMPNEAVEATTTAKASIPFERIEVQNNILFFKDDEAFKQTLMALNDMDQTTIDAFEERLNFHSLQQDIDDQMLEWNQIEYPEEGTGPHRQQLAMTPLAVISNSNREYAIGQTIYKILEDNVILEISNADFAALDIARTSPERALDLENVTTTASNSNSRFNCYNNNSQGGTLMHPSGVYRLIYTKSVSSSSLMKMAIVQANAKFQAKIGSKWFTVPMHVKVKLDASFCKRYPHPDYPTHWVNYEDPGSLTTVKSDGNGFAGLIEKPLPDEHIFSDCGFVKLESVVAHITVGTSASFSSTLFDFTTTPM